MNEPNQMNSSIPVSVNQVPPITNGQSGWSKFWDFIIGFFGFGFIDGAIIWGVINLSSNNPYAFYFVLLALAINFIGIFYFQKRRKYLMYGIIWIFASPILLFLFVFGSCFISPLFNR